MIPETGFVLFPALKLHPKFYYNIDKRASKNRNTTNNSANCFGLQIGYIPDWFTISNCDVSTMNQLVIIPTFGFRKNFGEKLRKLSSDIEKIITPNN